MEVFLLALCFNLGCLFFFKYSGLTEKLPLGISFYTFQIISYEVDVYKGKINASKSLINYMT